MASPGTGAPISHPQRAERVVEQTISVFRWGYRLSFALVAVGVVVALVRDLPLAAELGPPQELARHLMDLDPNGFIGLGIGVMILTPVVMAVEVAVNLFRENDRRYALVTAIVALILIITFTLTFA